MAVILGLSVSPGAIGWALVKESGGLIDLGVRIFETGEAAKPGADSPAVVRYNARKMRRKRDRFLKRQHKMLNGLVRHGLMPEDESERKGLESLDPYELRARGVIEKITPHELGRALFHLNQRRGYQSNSLLPDKDSGKIKAANKVLERAILATDSKTLGQYLCSLHTERVGVRARLRGDGVKAKYNLYPTRAMITAEFDVLWEEQKKHYPDLLTDTARDYLRETLLFQRPLKVRTKPEIVDHPGPAPTVLVSRLPYYGIILADRVGGYGSGNPRDALKKRYGGVTKPGLHLALNQVRTVVNSLLKQYGKPDKIVVELARDLKKSWKKKAEDDQRQREMQAATARADAILTSLDQPLNRRNRQRLRLHEQQGGLCPYCGDPIEISEFFSGEADLDHILPFSRTLDNSENNTVVVHAMCNRAKANRTPDEAFHGIKYEQVLARVQDLPHNKRQRFKPDAMHHYQNEDHDFLDRQLTDTQYFARWTREYLAHLVGPEQVWATPGHLTGLLRGKLGLNNLLPDHNRKNRDDHRHHAVNGFAVALTTRPLLQKIAAASEAEQDHLIGAIPDPWEGFQEEVRQRLESMVVSHRPDHGTPGKLFEATAYGLVREDKTLEEGYNLVFRKPVTALTAREVDRIRDVKIRERLQNYIANSSGKLEKILHQFSEETGIRRLRLLKREKNCITIKNSTTKDPYKALIPDGNHHVDIFTTADGEWTMVGVTVFEANQKGTTESWRADNPGAKLIMRVHKGDMLDTDVDGKRDIVRVVSLGPSVNKNVGRLDVVLHSEGGEYAKRAKDQNDPFVWKGFRLLSTPRMQKTATCKVRVSPTGQVMRLRPLEE